MMLRSTQLKRDAPLKRGKPLKRSAELKRTALERHATLARSTKPAKRRAVSPASRAQREKVKGLPCIVCGDPGPCDPMHVIPRSQGGCDDPACVVPACRLCHRDVAEGRITLLAYLEPTHRVEQAHAALHVGIGRAYRRLTGKREARARALDEAR